MPPSLQPERLHDVWDGPGVSLKVDRGSRLGPGRGSWVETVPNSVSLRRRTGRPGTPMRVRAAARTRAAWSDEVSLLLGVAVGLVAVEVTTKVRR